jgi:hypothetical protein
MSIRKAGPVCDVCANYILVDKSINPFSVKGIAQVLHCHDRCKPLVIHMMEKKDYSMLPLGPLRTCFEEHYKP